MNAYYIFIWEKNGVGEEEQRETTKLLLRKEENGDVTRLGSRSPRPAARSQTSDASPDVVAFLIVLFRRIYMPVPNP